MSTAGMMPELGSKISLISKADIRYEGKLFTVDPQECTIALANVRSFGTEDRETPYPIAPQPTVYDYILFRGSDIKDIRVVNNVAIPNDPAIMQMHLPPQQQGFPPQNFPPMQQQPGQYAPFGQMQGPPMNANNMAGPNLQQQLQQSMQSPQMQQQQQQQQQNMQSNQQQGNTTTNNLTPTNNSGHSKKSSELSKIEKPSEKSSSQTTSSSQSSAPMRKQSNKSQDSRSGTPNARKSPTGDMGSQTGQNRGDNNANNKDKVQRNQRNNNNMNNNNNRERRDSGRNNNERIERNHEQQHDNRRGGGYRQQNQRGMQSRGGYNNRNNQNNNNNHQMRGNQGSGRMRVPNFYRPNQNKPNGSGPQGNKIAFENEFDFEQANSKFEELRSQLAKLKVGTEENKSTEQVVNGEIEKKDDSGNETGVDHEAESDDVRGYDKTKSFFDNISCEANERSKGKPQRPDWRQERKINSETFGLSMNRRGGMRGRGYYNRNQYNNRSNYRSGVPSQYRNYNNRNNANRNGQNNNSGRTNNNNQGQQQQSSTIPSTNQQQAVAAK